MYSLAMLVENYDTAYEPVGWSVHIR
jgi:hypothetical protein